MANASPTSAATWLRFGQSLQSQGRLSEALRALQTAVQCDPANASVHCDLGTLLFGLDRPAEALDELRHAINLDPAYAPAHGNLGALLARSGHPVAAEAESRKAIALAPGQHRWLTNLGVALFSQGRHSDAEECYRKALAMRPDYAVGHGNLLFALNYHPDINAQSIAAEYREWDRRHARPLASAAPFRLDRTAGRRLRIGYVSADFRQHAVAMFAEPLLAAHDRTNVEIYLYAGVAAEDAATHRFRSLCDEWRSTIGVSDAALADLIRADQIDVLVDLSGHSAGNRLLTFARCPAPVQIAYLLGHGYSTGLSAMDAFLADASLAPPGTEELFTERIIRLPRIPIVYLPPPDMPAVTPLPAQANGFVTFGHFGRPERLNEHVIVTWARILHGLPNARLVLNNRPFQEPAFRDIFLARFARHGIDPSHLELIASAPQSSTWAAYGRIDIALDPFPHNAGTTTIEALWQGVPVVSLAARPTVGRFGASILHAVGLDDWVTIDPNAYVARALTAAADLGALASLRRGLRDRVARSPLRDAAGLARAVEAVYRSLWDEWREGAVARLHRLYRESRFIPAANLAQRMLQRNAGSTCAHHVLGLLAYRDGRLADADRHLKTALALDPDTAEYYANHAAILRKLGHLQEAEAAARTALKLEPRRVGAHNNLGNILRDAGRYGESAECYRTAVHLAPDAADAWINLAWVLALTGQAKQSEEAARQAIRCEPQNADGHNNLSLALMRQGRLAEAETALRAALALRPDFALPHSNILFCLNYRPDVSAENIYAEYQRWDRQHAKPLLPLQPKFALDRTPNRRLRVGYVSPDFRQHAVALFAEPLLRAHDRSAVEIHCYAEVPAPDAVTDRFRALIDHWHNTVGLTDADLAETIRRDQIDVLVDLAGHTAGNRLLVFARKPAPVQVEWLLGHGYTSGLSAMDAFLADGELAPHGSDHLFSERVIRLSRVPFVYAPPADMPPVAPLRARSAGSITFGYFGRTVRLHDTVIATWARILLAVPGSRLMLNNSPFGEAAGRELMASRFAGYGVDPARLLLTYTSPQTRTWAAYGEVDIALDPFPHNAGTTTIEALWQGVPVVSLAGRPTVGRFGAAILHAVGLDDWLTHDVDGYVTRAIAAASDIEGLARLRATLRDRMAASALCDAEQLAREVETAYRSLWQHWCASQTPDPRQIYAGGDIEGAARCAAQVLARDPDNTAALHVQGLLRYGQGEVIEAARLLQRATADAPDAAVLCDLGVMLRRLRRLAEAEAAYRRALQADPSLAAAWGNLGNVLIDQQRPREAEQALTRALALTPDRPWLLRSLALSLIAQNSIERAERLLRQAVAIDPDDADAHDTLGALLAQSGRPIEAEAHHRAALPTTQQRHRVLSNLAMPLQAQGRHAEADACCREALARQPGYAAAHCNRLFSLNYRPDLSAEEIFTEYRNWNRDIAQPLAPAAPAFSRQRVPSRRLRIGYVSADFRQHSAAWFAEPLLAAHDRTQCEVTCYAQVAAPDGITDRFRQHANRWRNIAGADDAAVADMIRADAIDILVDMSGHTSGSRLLVFARRPAPVQVEYLLGHGYTSGLSAMDAFLADAMLAPPGADHLFSERLIRLPRIPLAYRPPDGMPETGPLPAAMRGSVTFGYFGRPERLNTDVIAAWTAILRQVSNARLVLNSPPFREPAFRQLVAARFAAQGVVPERLEMLATAPQAPTWQAYRDIDIALDPFPHNAGTTTIEALWLGIPVVSLTGRPSVGRFGAMILHAVGLDDWITGSTEAYVARAVAAASDLGSLGHMRGALRPALAASPLCDANDLARQIERAYRELWQAWCAAC